MKNIHLIIATLILLLLGCQNESEFGNSPFADLSTNSKGGSANPATTGLTTGEQYNEYQENDFVSVIDSPISTFSIDADGGSYTNMRRFVKSGQLPPDAAVRIEEFINYFNFDYPAATGNHPISLNGEVSDCPWNTDNKLIRIGIKGKDIPESQLPSANFVLLIDVSGSMGIADKLPFFQDAIMLFIDELTKDDLISVVTYAGAFDVALDATSGDQKKKIKDAIKGLHAGGGTNGEGGIRKAYEIAEDNFIDGGNNRIIMVTDGDFNVGISNQDELIKLVEDMRDKDIFLTTIGVGSGNLQEGKLEQLANHGNGNFEYLDQESQAEKLFIHEYQKFFTVAKDVKVQVEFNSNVVEQYRLIGYENRVLSTEDFEDDTKDAGEIGAGQSITALYEIVPGPGLNWETQATFTIDFRYKMPDSDSSVPLDLAIFDRGKSFDDASENMRFAASLAGYGMLLIDSKHKGSATFNKVKKWGKNARSFDPYGFRDEYIDLINMAEKL